MQARMAYRFFVGTSPNLSLEDKRRLAEEATVYGDIIMLDTLDTYNRLPFVCFLLLLERELFFFLKILRFLFCFSCNT